ncbi:HEAT repeat domain-containing protein [Kitasatospora sp. NPDC085895]|uniref:HEAT repeat domain-containing protein n=1 Tax=Kitasatospora sp. NPDC085895 TaxID=3155057 RepID=UPI00344D01D9
MTSENNDSVFAGLDDIDWASLEHAYGPAGDVPDQLRALCGEGRDDRGRALHALYGNIFHQGSRYQASAFAVPFLARMAADRSRRGRAQALELMSGLAIGYDEAHLPDGVAVAAWRRGVEDLRAKGAAATTAEYDDWVARAADDGERRVREFQRRTFDYDRHLGAYEAELAAYDAVAREVPALAALLSDEEPAVRASTCHVLAWFPEQAAAVLPQLLDLADREQVPAVAATALIAAGLLGDAATVERLRPFLAADEPVVRWGAAIGLARLGSTGAEAAVDAEVLAELAAVEAEEPDGEELAVPFQDGDLNGYAALALTQVADRYPAEALDAVTTGLARASGPAAFPVTAAALRLAFGGSSHADLPPFAELDHGQQRLVTTLASLGDDTWCWGNFLQILRGWDIPADRTELRAYAGLPTA